MDLGLLRVRVADTRQTYEAARQRWNRETQAAMNRLGEYGNLTVICADATVEAARVAMDTADVNWIAACTALEGASLRWRPRN